MVSTNKEQKADWTRRVPQKKCDDRRGECQPTWMFPFGGGV